KLIDERFARRADLKPVAGKHRVTSATQAPDVRDAVPARARVFDYARTLPPAVTVNSQGAIRCEHEDLHFQAARTLAMLADPSGLDRWQVSRASIKRALSRNLTPEQVTEMLRSTA